MPLLNISNAAEAALAYIFINRDELPYTTTDGMLVQAYLELRAANMIEGVTDWGHQMFNATSIQPAGIEHYQHARRIRRRFAALTETADELICLTYARTAQHRRNGKEDYVDILENRVSDYRELARTGLLDIKWADNEPLFASITEKGISYVEGDFMEEGSNVNISIANNPTFNNTNVGSLANASAKTDPITIENAIEGIRNCEIDSSVKQSAEAAIMDMNTAVEEGSIEKFASALEKVASIVKSTTTLGAILLPLARDLIFRLLA